MLGSGVPSSSIALLIALLSGLLETSVSPPVVEPGRKLPSERLQPPPSEPAAPPNTKPPTADSLNRSIASGLAKRSLGSTAIRPN